MLNFKPTNKKAVAYYRHSAEDKQENSVPIQREHAQKFAKDYDIDIIHEEADEGKSGLTAARPGFERLFDEWVLNPEAPQFDYVLVLDVSRWGRFQDPDEAAYWEMQCKKRDIRVIYMTRGFPKEEERLLTSLETSIGRYMAAEYSRQQSDKVWHGAAKVSEQGFSAGGTAPYGYTRILLDEQHNRVGILKDGEHKVIANQRVTFEPASGDSPSIIKEIFRLFVSKWMPPQDIAEHMNKKGVLSPGGKTWDSTKIVRILSNETYIGTRIYNKTWSRLKQKQRKNPVEEWIRCENAFGAIIDEPAFRKAQENLYWLTPTIWKRGTYQINKIHRLVQQELETALKENGSYDEDVTWHTLRNFPIVYGITFYQNSIPHWCFMITERLRKFESVVGVSINLYHRDSLGKFFVLPTKDFGLGNFLALSERDAAYEIEPEKIEEKFLNLSEKAAMA